MSRSHLHRGPRNRPSKFITTRCSGIKVAWLQESTSFGGHSIPKGGHRKVSGIVRACFKEETRKEITQELSETVKSQNPGEKHNKTS